MTIEEVLNKLVVVRKRQGITQREVAEKLGVGVQYLSMIENGRASLSMRRFLRICEALEILPQEVLYVDDHYFSRREILAKAIDGLLPQEMELLVGIAQLMRDRRTVL